MRAGMRALFGLPELRLWLFRCYRSCSHDELSLNLSHSRKPFALLLPPNNRLQPTAAGAIMSRRG